jgi:phage baseplate assembly protein W
MGSINFNNLKNTNTRAINYTYTDIYLDLQEKPSGLNAPIGEKSQGNKDIKISFDLNAIRNSIINIFNTVPGERFLLPDFGCDLRRFIFEPISDFRGSNIARIIRRNIDAWEPRVTLVSIDVTGFPDKNEYGIDLVLQVPFLGSGGALGLNAVLNNEGFAING